MPSRKVLPEETTPLAATGALRLIAGSTQAAVASPLATHKPRIPVGRNARPQSPYL